MVYGRLVSECRDSILVALALAVAFEPNKVSSLPRSTLTSNDAITLTEMDFNRTPIRTANQEYSREEESCFREKKVYYRGSCADLLKKGPCDSGEWLVLDAESAGLKARCAKSPCPESQAFWPETESCIPRAPGLHCNRRQTTVEPDAFGLGTCKCTQGKVKAMASTGACYELYERGPCSYGKTVQVNDQGEAVCLTDKCAPVSGGISNSNETLLDYNGRCYKAGDRGPCREGEILIVDPNVLRPACNPGLTLNNLIDPPSLCDKVDHKKFCVDSVYIEEQKMSFLQNLNKDASKRRKKRYGVSKT